VDRSTAPHSRAHIHCRTQARPPAQPSRGFAVRLPLLPLLLPLPGAAAGGLDEPPDDGTAVRDEPSDGLDDGGVLGVPGVLDVLGAGLPPESPSRRRAVPAGSAPPRV
jgi:hypothetical protein